MNLFSIIIVTVLIFQSMLVSCIGLNSFNIFSKLPFGQYQLVFKHVKSCNSSQDNKFQQNFYLSHNPKSNVTEIKGTIINTIPFDDNLFMEATFALKDADGNWKDNTFIHKSPKACSSLRLLLGDGWTSVMSHLGIKNATCPIPPGVYTAPGLDTTIFLNTNIPKTFVYGTFKVKYYYSRYNEVYGCIVYIIEFKRP